MSPGTPPTDLTLALVAHTNVGKTTLARTLLRRDVGQVLDQAHVTRAQRGVRGRAHGRRPPAPRGHARLRRLAAAAQAAEGRGQPDRLVPPPGLGSPGQTSRSSARRRPCARCGIAPTSCSISSTPPRRPADAGYVEPEMEILALGRQARARAAQPDRRRRRRRDRAATWSRPWREHVRRHALVRDVLALDAFTRCWVEEHVAARRASSRRCPRATARSRPRSPRRGRGAISRPTSRASIAWRPTCRAAAADRATLPRSASAADRKQGDGGARRRGSRRRRARRWPDVLALHGLDGASAAKIEEEMKDFTIHGQEKVSPRKGALWGGLVSGALSGLAADLAVGGLSFGGGAVIGAILGALRRQPAAPRLHAGRREGRAGRHLVPRGASPPRARHRRALSRRRPLRSRARGLSRGRPARRLGDPDRGRADARGGPVRPAVAARGRCVGADGGGDPRAARRERASPAGRRSIPRRGGCSRSEAPHDAGLGSAAPLSPRRRRSVVRVARGRRRDVLAGARNTPRKRRAGGRRRGGAGAGGRGGRVAHGDSRGAPNVPHGAPRAPFIATATSAIRAGGRTAPPWRPAPRARPRPPRPR